MTTLPPWHRAEIADAVAFAQWLRAHNPALFGLCDQVLLLLVFDCVRTAWDAGQEKLWRMVEASHSEMNPSAVPALPTLPELRDIERLRIHAIRREIRARQWDASDTNIWLEEIDLDVKLDFLMKKDNP